MHLDSVQKNVRQYLKNKWIDVTNLSEQKRLNMIEVVNLRGLINEFPDWYMDPAFLYIGRGSIWGNPFKIGKNGSRTDVIQKYKEYARKTYIFQEAIENLLFLEKKLVCYCAPRACHGDFLKFWQEEYIKIMIEDTEDEEICDL